MKRKALILAGVLMITSLTACAPQTNLTNGVMGEVNGVKITREMLGDNLTQAEKEVVGQYVNDYLLKEYYKDVEVSEIEIAAQLAIIKGQVGEDQWEGYLQYTGFNDEITFSKELETNIKREKKMATFEDQVEITDEELKSVYDENPNAFNLMVTDLIFYDTEESYNKGVEALSIEGSTLESIAEASDGEIKNNEHVTFMFDGFNKPTTEMVVGDLIYTTKDSGVLAIGKVTKVSNSFEVLKEEVRDQQVSKKTNELVEKDLEEFYEKSSVTILGEKVR